MVCSFAFWPVCVHVAPADPPDCDNSLIVGNDLRCLHAIPFKRHALHAETVLSRKIAFGSFCEIQYSNTNGHISLTLGGGGGGLPDPEGARLTIGAPPYIGAGGVYVAPGGNIG